jgi:hypothetical protein
MHNGSFTPQPRNVGWSEFLSGSAPGHAVQIYTDLSELAGSVAPYLASGFDLGEPAVVVATPEHLTEFMAELEAAGWDEMRIDRAGLLAVADADETLAAIMDGGDTPSPSAFEHVVGAVFDRFPGRRVRAFGEMVDLLCRRGQQEAAITLEELWNDLSRRRTFSLLCGYQLDVFDRESQAGTLPHVCRAHSHVLPVPDPARLQRAVDEALEEVLGAAEAGKVYVVVGQEIRADRVPMAQVLLMLVSENMPALAERVLASTRARYLDEPVVA